MTGEQYKKLICSFGCIVTGEPAVPHHPKCFHNGAGKVSDFLCIPLAPRLHSMQDDSIHRNKSVFEMKYGREADLLARTIAEVADRLHRRR